MFFLYDADRHVTTTISIKSLTLKWTHSNYVSGGLFIRLNSGHNLVFLRLINLLNYTRLKNYISNNISIGKKYHGVPKLVELRYEGTKPFHLVGTIPEYLEKSGQRF